jgi:preprotein translocase subunit SecF
VQDVFTETLGFDPVTVQVVGAGDTASIQIRSEALDAGQVENLQRALFTEFSPTDRAGNVSMAAISTAEVSETWGGQITQKAIIALIVFLVLVTIYIAVRFEWDMAVASIASLIFDLVMTAGIYALIGFEVTPATVIGLLTILGFSLYDTVVVFDKVEENTRGVLQTYRRTYAEQANLAVNQTFMRSINTTIIGVLPILALMIIAVWMLGVGTLKDLALVQIVGVIVGAYSSVFFATPLLVTLKERNPKVVEHTKKVLSKRAARQSRASTAAEPASEPVSMAKAGVGASSAVAPRRARTPQPGARPTGKRRRT